MSKLDSNGVTRPPRWSGLRLALLAFAQFIIAIDYNIVYVALPDIGRDVGFTPQSLQWVVSAYAVAFGGFLLLGGRAADRLGPRRMFILALVLYGVSSFAGGFAPDALTLVIARAVQGLGGALLFPATLALINTSFAEGAERNRALAVWGATGSGGLAAGAIIGGVLTNGWGWQAVFFFTVPLALGAALIAAPALLAPPDPVGRGQRRSFDLPGALVVTAAATLLVFGLASGPEVGWNAVRSSGSLVIGVLLLCAFILIERRVRDPLAPLRLFANRSLVTAMGVSFFHHMALSSGYYILTTYFQNLLGYNALAAGLAFVPLGVLAMIGGGKGAALLLTKWGTRATMFAGMLVYGIGLVAIALALSPGGSYWAVLPGILIYGFGGGIAFTTLFVAAASGVAANEQGVASALGSTSLQIGAALGLAAVLVVANVGLGGGPATASDVVDGLRMAGLFAAAAVFLGAVLALMLKQNPGIPQDAAASAEAAR
ncbi:MULTISPECIES: MFS transporter [Mesorhizobium]|uniref:MFS transporter n=1 Tax=Mesorhizobium TaxID=68287 RepID=UPI00197DF3AC|nr:MULTISPECIES: MFS transporter [Mesorhizobium]